ncbi:MAG: hypothetical protein ACRDRP_19620 [Pseudonocardiaceae bacterium]
MVEVREVLRAWLEGHGLRAVAGRAGVGRKTARRYVAGAQAGGTARLQLWLLAEAMARRPSNFGINSALAPIDP